MLIYHAAVMRVYLMRLLQFVAALMQFNKRLALLPIVHPLERQYMMMSIGKET